MTSYELLKADRHWVRRPGGCQTPSNRPLLESSKCGSPACCVSTTRPPQQCQSLILGCGPSTLSRRLPAIALAKTFGLERLSEFTAPLLGAMMNCRNYCCETPHSLGGKDRQVVRRSRNQTVGRFYGLVDQVLPEIIGDLTKIDSDQAYLCAGYSHEACAKNAAMRSKFCGSRSRVKDLPARPRDRILG